MRGPRPASRVELVALGGFVFVAAVGSPVVFLAGWTAVYHEAIVWGVAWALVSSGFLVAHLETGRRRDLVAASGAAACSVLSRGSVGFGPIAAIGFVLAGEVLADVRVRRFAGRGAAIALLGACLVVPIALYAGVNQAKFDSAFGLPPYEKQDLLIDWPSRGPALDANGGTLFGPGYAPTILLQYLRPDGVGVDRLFPWVTFSGPPSVVGDAVFESLNNSISLTAGSPLLVALAALGLVAALGRRAASFRAPLAGAAVGCVGALSLAFVDERYQGDFLPLLLPAAALGLWWLLAAVGRRRWRGGRRALAVVLVVGAGWSAWADSAVALTYQRLYRADVTTGERAAFVGFQLRLQQALHGTLPSRVEHGDERPTPAEAGTLFVLGRCDAVYWSDGRDWHPVETTAATGSIHLRVVLHASSSSADGVARPLVTTADDVGAAVVWVERDGGGVRVSYRWEPRLPGADPSFAARQDGPPLPVAPDQPVDLDVELDRRGVVGTNVTVSAGGRRLLQAYGPLAISPVVLGHQHVMDGAVDFDGEVSLRPSGTPICDRLVAMGLPVDR